MVGVVAAAIPEGLVPKGDSTDELMMVLAARESLHGDALVGATAAMADAQGQAWPYVSNPLFEAAAAAVG